RPLHRAERCVPRPLRLPLHHGGAGRRPGRDPGRLRPACGERRRHRVPDRAGRGGADRPAAPAGAAGVSTTGAALLARLDALAAFTDEPGRLTRLYLSPAHRAAADRVVGWMAEAGLAVRIDPMGTVVGR